MSTAIAPPRPAASRDARAARRAAHRPPDPRRLRQPPSRAGQRDQQRGHAELDAPSRHDAAFDDRRVRAARGSAGRTDGQFGGRPSQHRRRPRHLPGLHAHRPCDRNRRIRAQPGARRRRWRRAKREASTLHVLGLLSPGGVHSHERQIGALVDLAATAGCDGISASTRSSTAATRRRAAPPRRWPTWTASARSMPARAWPRSSGAISRWTATSAGTASRRPTNCWSTERARTPRRRARGRARRRLRTRRERRVRRGHRDPRRRGTAVDDEGRRRRRVHEFPRRPRAADHARADRPRRSRDSRAPRVPKLASYVCLTSYGDEFAHLPVAFLPQSIHNSFGEYIAGLG